MEGVRRRDAERLDLETVGGIYAGLDLIQGNAAAPAHGAGSLEADVISQPRAAAL